MKNKVSGNKSKSLQARGEQDIQDILLDAHRKSVNQAIELSIRTGVPLVVQVGDKKRSNRSTSM